MADMWTQYNRQSYQSQVNRSRNPQVSSRLVTLCCCSCQVLHTCQTQSNKPYTPFLHFLFLSVSFSLQKGRTMMSTMLESVRERGTKPHMETQAPPSERGQQTHGPPQHPSSEPGEGRTALNPFNQGQGPAHIGQPRKEAWSQATVDPDLGDPSCTKDGLKGSATHLPHIGSGEGERVCS